MFKLLFVTESFLYIDMEIMSPESKNIVMVIVLLRFAFR